MQVADSSRYREAVARLRRLLYEPPEWESPRGSPSPVPRDPLSHTTTTDYHHHHHHSYHNTVTTGDDVVGVSRNGEGATGVGGGAGVDRASRWLLELLRHQEELIAQLEKENDYLKREVVSLGDGVRRMGQENTDLNRRLVQALGQAITVGEASDSCSSVSSGHSGEKDATNTRIAALARDKSALQEQVRLLDASLAAMSRREQEALTKLKNALTLAEDTHSHTSQVRASSESALEELTTLLTATKQEGRELRDLLDEADNKLRQQQEQREEQLNHHQQRIKSLQAERDQQDETLVQLREELRDSRRKVSALEEDLGVAKASRTRLEAQLEEQRMHSKEAHARLDQIIVTRSGEAASEAARARDLEERLTAARQDTNRLLHTITTLAQGSGRSLGPDDAETHTDDVKSERLAAEHQLNSALSALQTRHEGEVANLREATHQQREAMDALREEVATLRQQLAQDNQSYRQRQKQQEAAVARFREELEQAHEQVLRGQEQARLHGALYQQALQKAKQAEGKAAQAEQQSCELVETVRAANKERDSLLREVSLLRQVVAAATPTITTPAVLKLLAAAAGDNTTPAPPAPSVATAAAAAPPPSCETPQQGLIIASGSLKDNLGPKQRHEDPPQQAPAPADTTPCSRVTSSTPAAVLAADEIFRDVVVSPGVTLVNLYQQ